MTNAKIFGAWLFAVALSLLARDVYADPHVTAKPEDYRLKSDLELSTGQIVPKGTAWYVPPDVKRLKKELTSGKYQGDIEKAKLIDFGYELVYNTYNTIGAGRKDSRPPLRKAKSSIARTAIFKAAPYLSLGRTFVLLLFSDCANKVMLVSFLAISAITAMRVHEHATAD